MALPVLTDEQRADALAKAAAARKARREALADLAQGRISLADALSGEDPRLSKVKVRRVLTALPRVGYVTADKALELAGVAEGRRIAGLGPNQRRALAEHFAA